MGAPIRFALLPVLFRILTLPLTEDTMSMSSSLSSSSEEETVTGSSSNDWKISDSPSEGISSTGRGRVACTVTPGRGDSSSPVFTTGLARPNSTAFATPCTLVSNKAPTLRKYLPISPVLSPTTTASGRFRTTLTSPRVKRGGRPSHSHSPSVKRTNQPPNLEISTWETGASR
ncbi:hypothetical protein BC832DRAFT_552508 [Gaertneriomyces semiglobifer]|nr:hypothetical protein BC832DRAFT_552508 [Gaertneriomyces semiglobifer]